MVSKPAPISTITWGWAVSNFFDKTIIVLLTYQIHQRIPMLTGFIPHKSAFLRQILVNHHLPKCSGWTNQKKRMFDDSTPLLLIMTVTRRCARKKAGGDPISRALWWWSCGEPRRVSGPRVVTSNICRNDWNMGMGQLSWVNKDRLINYFR